MSIFEPGSPPWTSRMRSVFRIVIGLLFMLHGTQKMFGFPPSNMPAMPFNLMSQFGIAGVLETFGGALIVLGFLTRPVAFVLAGEMAVAYFQAHFPRGFYPTSNGGEAAVLYCFSFLYLMFAGAGAWSIDARMGRRHDRYAPPNAPHRHIDAAA
jgi:putative oxidoreductase